jgi:hypothetical protein
VTQWVETVEGGRERGPAAVARAWVEVLLRPRRFFRTAVAPGDQAPGLIFLILVVGVAAGTRLALVPGLRPVYLDRPALSALFVLLAVATLAAPLALHLLAALQTLLLLALVRDRAGVSETVQTIAYASAPCALAGLPYPSVQAVCGAYGAVLLVLGLATVHDTSLLRAAAAGAPTAALAFGYGFGAFDALAALA